MPAAIDSQVKKHVINQWLSGDSRDRIADDNEIGAGYCKQYYQRMEKRNPGFRL